ncbi:MAG: hypothetical protein Fur0016_15260 [Anaerolineales bacterium]
MYLRVVWLINPLQRVPFVTRLSTALLATAFAQTARSRLLQPIAGGGLAAVAAVPGRLIFQRLHPAGKLADRPFEQRNNSLLPLQAGFVNLFAGRHHKSGHGAIVAELYDFGKLRRVNL